MDGNIEKTLEERGNNYGSFWTHSQIAQMLKNSMKATEGWDKLENDQKEALEMIAHKIARILNGNPNHKDSWHDIAGYAILIDKRRK